MKNSKPYNRQELLHRRRLKQKTTMVDYVIPSFNNLDKLALSLGFDDNLVTELLNFSKNLKAELAYHKCIKNGRLKWAADIKSKYGIKTQVNDRVDAFALALLYSKSK